MKEGRTWGAARPPGAGPPSSHGSGFGLQEQAPEQPSQIPGFIGTPDWDLLNYCIDMPALPRDIAKSRGTSGNPSVEKSLAEEPTGRPIHGFAQWLYDACTVHEPSLEATRVPLVQLFGLQGRASAWGFPPSAVYSEARVS